METLEFIIHADGRVEEKVTGIVGSSCAEVTAAIEAKLGKVVSCELTSEHFATNQACAQTTAQHNSQYEMVGDRLATAGEPGSFSQW
ncbi:hypothetical protein Pse7367_0776 [Thalassoporum mexicanum PCC 7367]|uniref:DUF2997 domain-containing protein n=1 Tax=Thalassoporum mexicanum TaxID=3457544 RepID=UPI00029FA1C1|nr:DUF2997 domain-containing protein [Pseudanabaena sp. PCC 7367]AFY69077.1 hypothetical protein Pse7367_0776 [Pseudanabaena sp. PCC 7367]